MKTPVVSITDTALITPGSPTPRSGRHFGGECVRATQPCPEATEARPAWGQLPAPCRGLPAHGKGRPQRRGQQEGRGREQRCVTPSTTFPAQPATAEVPETREAGSSKTSSSERPKAWELNRPKPRVARRQHDQVRGLSHGHCHSPHLPPPRPPHIHTKAPLLGAPSAASTR